MTGADTVWVLPDGSPPLNRVVSALAAAIGPMDVLLWQDDGTQGRSYGRSVSLARTSGELDVTVKVVSPRLAVALARHPARTVMLLEIDLTAVYAVATRRFRRGRQLICLVEGDPRKLGQTGSARWKVAFRRLVARGIDHFIANSEDASRYLQEVVGVPATRITTGWWLAGLPAELQAIPPTATQMARGTGPIFATVGRLTALKGHDLFLRAAAAYSSEVGPCRVWMIGDGEESGPLHDLAVELGIQDSVTFFGRVDHAHLKGALQACDAFVFPTLVDLVGRALVEAISVGALPVVSDRSGAIDALVTDDVNAIIVDPLDPRSLLDGLIRSTDPGTVARLRRGIAATQPQLDLASAVASIRRGMSR